MQPQERLLPLPAPARPDIVVTTARLQVQVFRDLHVWPSIMTVTCSSPITAIMSSGRLMHRALFQPSQVRAPQVTLAMAVLPSTLNYHLPMELHWIKTEIC